jgi:D-alanyl-D-alanine carboxypeptidase/D-alanyl-D-alanine-endopeptidase (penicillin-binding protein 4)
VRVGYDDSLFAGPQFAPTWEPDYGPDEVVAPITALWVDEGRPRSGFGRVPDPSDRAARVFAAALAQQGITVLGAPEQVRAGADARELARVDSAPLAQIVERVLDVSDNEAAEVLGHHVGLAAGGEGSFAGGVRGVEKTLRDLGVPLTGAALYDGSGLSRADRLDPATLMALLRLVADPEHPELRPVLTGLPVAGFTGSLAYRFEEKARGGTGTVRAKTGTLTGVSGLAGVVTDRDGTPLVFVVVADKVAVVDTLDARAALDRIAADLAGCACTS